MRTTFSTLVYIVLTTLLVASCSDSTIKTEKEKTEGIFEYSMKMELNFAKEDFISLLAIKYDLNRELTKKIIKNIKRRDSAVDVFFKDFKSVEEFEQYKKEQEKLWVRDWIKTISIENDIDQKVIASLLIDYNIWIEIQNILKRL